MMKYRVTSRYYDSGKVTASYKHVDVATTQKIEGVFSDYDQYEEDFTNESDAKKSVRLALKESSRR